MSRLLPRRTPHQRVAARRGDGRVVTRWGWSQRNSRGSAQCRSSPAHSRRTASCGPTIVELRRPDRRGLLGEGVAGVGGGVDRHQVGADVAHRDQLVVLVVAPHLAAQPAGVELGDPGAVVGEDVDDRVRARAARAPPRRRRVRARARSGWSGPRPEPTAGRGPRSPASDGRGRSTVTRHATAPARGVSGPLVALVLLTGASSRVRRCGGDDAPRPPPPRRSPTRRHRRCRGQWKDLARRRSQPRSDGRPRPRRWPSAGTASRRPSTTTPPRRRRGLRHHPGHADPRDRRADGVRTAAGAVRHGAAAVAGSSTAPRRTPPARRRRRRKPAKKGAKAPKAPPRRPSRLALRDAEEAGAAGQPPAGPGWQQANAST